ncbi:hypothetical protein GB937_001386 [Aspergillus fischeri]|nr:hypothetical protein GB937_001386 [Aspergillus fischeri]
MDTAREDKAETGQAAYIAPLSTTPDSKTATEDEIQDLEHVTAKLPAWNSPGDLIPGVMGLGKSHAIIVNLAVTVVVNLLPIYTLESAVLFGTSFHSEMRSGIATGFILGSILIAVGLGCIQASVQPFIGMMLGDVHSADTGH